MTENEFSESEDEESIKASTKRSIPRLSATGGTAPPSFAEGTRPSSFYTAPPILYESKEVSVIPVEEPKPEVREISIQTDEWIPPAPSQPPPPMPSLF
jgi:hypothetical protein